MLGEVGSVLMLHRISPYEKGKIIYNENMKISPLELESIIQELKKERTFISMDDVFDILRAGKRPVKKFIAITLDDGYKDNLTYGYEILKKYDIPFCIYITNSFPNKTSNLWWYALENLILDNQSLVLKGKEVKNRSIREKQKNFLTIRSSILQHYFKEPLAFLTSLGDLNFNLDQEREHMLLTWSEIETLSNDPLVTIGSHTMNHYPLSQLSDDEVKSEIENSKAELQKHIHRSVRHFAFPFGTRKEASSREYRIASECNFDTITTTTHGHVHYGDNTQQLGRIFLFPPELNHSSLQKILYFNIRTAISFLRRAL